MIIVKSEGVDGDWYIIYDGNTEVGSLLVRSNFPVNGYSHAYYIDVANEYRRKGIATELFNYAEYDLNITLVPSGCLSQSQREFWKNRGTRFYELLNDKMTFSTDEIVKIILTKTTKKDII